MYHYMNRPDGNIWNLLFTVYGMVDGRITACGADPRHDVDILLYDVWLV